MNKEMTFKEWLEKRGKLPSENLWDTHTDPDEMIDFLDMTDALTKDEWKHLTRLFMEHAKVIAQDIDSEEAILKDFGKQVRNEQLNFIKDFVKEETEVDV